MRLTERERGLIAVIEILWQALHFFKEVIQIQLNPILGNPPVFKSEKKDFTYIVYLLTLRRYAKELLFLCCPERDSHGYFISFANNITNDIMYIRKALKQCIKKVLQIVFCGYPLRTVG